MTTRLPISSTDIASEAQFELADGKIVTLKTFCIEEQVQRVSIESLGIGDKFKTRDGQVFKIQEVSTTAGGDKLGQSSRRYLWFYNSGRCTNDDNDLDVIETLPRTLLDRVDEQLAKLNKDDIDRLVLSEEDFEELYGTACNSKHNGVNIKYNDCYRRGEFVFVFKTRK